MTQALSWQERIALKKETTWGTGVNPDVSFPITDGSISFQSTASYDEGRRGTASGTFDALIDAAHSEANIEGWFYPNASSWLLYGLFGQDSITGAGDPYTHTFQLASSVPSFTVEQDVIGGTNGAIRATGMRVGSMNFSFEADKGALTYSAQLMGKIPSKVTAQNPAITSENAFEGWRATLTSTGLDCKAVSGEINLTRELQIVHTGCDSQDVSFINAGPMQAEGRFNVVFDNMAIFDLALANTRQALTLSFTKGSPAREILFTLTDCFLNAQPFEFDYGGMGVQGVVGFRGIYNSTDAGVCKVAVKNSRATAYSA